MGFVGVVDSMQEIRRGQVVTSKNTFGSSAITAAATDARAAASSAEHLRLAEDEHGQRAWKRWGPYLSERQWGTVREDYSPRGDAWEYQSHDMARSRAYRWGEDGIAGIGDDRQLLCLAVALWNGCDPNRSANFPALVWSTRTVAAERMSPSSN